MAAEEPHQPRRWSLDSFPDRQGLPFVFRASGEVRTLGHERLSRTLESLLVEYVVGGEGWLEVGTQRWRLRPGDVYLVPAGVAQRIGPDPKNPWHKLWIEVAGPLPGALLAAYGLEGVRQVPEVWREDLFRLLLSLSRNQESDALDRAALVFHGVVQKLAAHAGVQAPSRQTGPVLAALGYLDRHFRERVTLDDLAAVAHRSRSQLVRLFRQETGQTPHDYLVSRRITHARHLLTSTDLKVYEIADELGFSDQYHFSAQFRKRTGLSPLAFRGRTEEP